MTENEGIWWIQGDVEGKRSDYATIKLIDTAMEHCAGRQMCLQAGGHCGLWARRLAHIFERVITIEPDAENYACLLRNIMANVEPIRAALGSAPGSTGLKRFPENTGANYMDGPGDIPVITIDSLNLNACDLIILDIEGMEAEALKGAKHTLRFGPTLLIEDKGLSEKFRTPKGWTESIPDYIPVYRSRTDKILVHASRLRS